MGDKEIIFEIEDTKDKEIDFNINKTIDLIMDMQIEDITINYNIERKFKK